MVRKKTLKEFLNEVYELVGNEYTALSEYTGSKNKVLMKHNECGYMWEVTPSHFKSGSRCPNKIHKRKTHDEFVKEIYELVGSKYEVLGKYKTNRLNLLMKHNECGNEWEVQPSHFLNGTRCPKCSIGIVGRKRRLTQEKFIQKVNEVHNGDYLVIGKYKGSHEHVEVKHVVCGHIYDVTATNITSGKGCPRCKLQTIGDSRRLTQKEYLRRVKEMHGDEYEPIEDYVTDDTHIKVRHIICGHVWKTKPSNFMRSGKGCPKCKQSKGEKRIHDYFDYSFYNYKTQYRLDDCKKVNVLPFDFAIFHENKLVCLIEYEGIQHFEPVEFFGGESYLKVVQEHDQIKRNYCKANNIPLIEIPYWEKDIEGILQDKLNEIHRMNNITSQQLSIF